MNMSKQDRRSSLTTGKPSRMPIGQAKDVEFSEEFADHEDWEALERSERASIRQHGRRG